MAYARVKLRRPLITLTSTTTTPATSSTWMNPPIVAALTIPNAHNSINTSAPVQIIGLLLVSC